jgi:hypothetical protein
MSAPLTVEHFRAMREVRNGADVYNYGIAGRLREVQRRWPHWISIGKAQMYAGDGTDQMPYFGAILTDAGKAALRVRGAA